MYDGKGQRDHVVQYMDQFAAVVMHFNLCFLRKDRLPRDHYHFYQDTSTVQNHEHAHKNSEIRTCDEKIATMYELSSIKMAKTMLLDWF